MIGSGILLFITFVTWEITASGRQDMLRGAEEKRTRALAAQRQKQLDQKEAADAAHHGQAQQQTETEGKKVRQTLRERAMGTN